MARRWKLGLLIFFSVILLLVAAAAFLRMNTKKHSPLDKINATVNGASIEVVYCRPAKKGRVIFGEPVEENGGPLQPWGQYWRLGANEATTIELNNTVSVGGQDLPAGKYSMYAIPRKDIWTVAINSVANRWGYGEPDYEKDVLTITVPVTYTDEVVESLTMSFNETSDQTNLVIKWDTSLVSIPLN